MAQAAKLREDYTHPEKIYKGLMWVPHGKISKAAWEIVKDIIGSFSGETFDRVKEELCWVCGWTVYDHALASYGSRIRIFHTRSNIGIWEVGSRWMISDRPNNASLANDFITQEFLRNHKPSLEIPLIKEMRKLSAPTDKVDLTLMSRAQGVSLDTIWHTLSSEQKSNYRNQLAAAIKKWRQFTSPICKNVDGSIPDDFIIGFCIRRSPTCTKMGRTTEDWFNNLEKSLRVGLSYEYRTNDATVIEEKFQELKKNFPKCKPYVLTHGDLNFSNIFVKDDKIEAIIDWEISAYLPWWAERWMSFVLGMDPTDELFYPLWADIGTEMDRDTFQIEVVEKVAPVLEAWSWAQVSNEVKHTNSDSMWLRPGFCKCKPFGGGWDVRHIGLHEEHIVKDSDTALALSRLELGP